MEERFDLSTLTVNRIAAALFLPAGSVQGFVTTPFGQTKHFDCRQYHGLIFSKSGYSEYWVDDRLCLKSTENWLVYLPQGCAYTVRSHHSYECWCINFHVADEIAPPAQNIPVRNAAHWRDLFNEAANLWTYRTVGWSARCYSILYTLLASAAEESQTHYLPGSRASVIQRVMHRYEELDQLCKNEISVAHLAEECGMSETYFRRLFREIYGESPMQYIREARFRRAKTLLESSSLPVSSIAELCGFESLYHFSRAFHQHENTTPTAYRLRR